MRKILVCVAIAALCALLCQTALAAGDTRLPAQINEVLTGSSWNGYTVSQIDDLAEWGARDTVAVVMSKGERNVLCLFSKSGGGWKLAVKREKVLYAGDQDIRLQFPDERHFVLYYEFGSRAEDYWFVASGAGKTQWTFEKARIWSDRRVDPSTGDVSAKIVEVTPIKDGLAYQSYRFESDKPPTQVSDKTRVCGVIYTDLDAFNIYTFPKNVKDAQEKLSLPAVLPESTQRDALPDGKTGAFKKDQKYTVYSGPSESAFRPANGKAAVSTNDWIQVFGRENDMVLIQYAISSDQARFGYISCDALEDVNLVEPLEFVFEPVALAGPADLTDDPLYSQKAIAQLRAGEQVQYLGTFGDGWTYVETLTTPRKRGFIPSACVDTQTAASETVAAPAGALSR